MKNKGRVSYANEREVTLNLSASVYLIYASSFVFERLLSLSPA